SATAHVPVDVPGDTFTADLDVDLGVHFDLDLAVGVDLTSTQAGKDMVFVRVDELAASASVDAAIDNLGVTIPGAAGATVNGGTAHLEARVELGLVDPNDDDKITLSELLDGVKHPSTFIDATTTGSLEVLLPLDVTVA